MDRGRPNRNRLGRWRPNPSPSDSHLTYVHEHHVGRGSEMASGPGKIHRKQMSREELVHRIAEETGYRPNHIRRMLRAVAAPDDFRRRYVRETILKALDTPDDAVGLLSSAFGIRRSKAALIVSMAHEPVADPGTGTPWWKRMLPW